MKDLILYIKGKDAELDQDFQNKKKYGDVFYFQKYLYTKKEHKWFYYPTDNICKLEIITGTRQLRQCCGAPIYQTKTLLVTTTDQERLYFDVEDTNNGDQKNAEALIEVLRDHKIIQNLFE